VNSTALEAEEFCSKSGVNKNSTSLESNTNLEISQGIKSGHKKGEVVVPAGGETGRPHCLAEVYKAVKTALYLNEY